jgi:hypothetical protein
MTEQAKPYSVFDQVKESVLIGVRRNSIVIGDESFRPAIVTSTLSAYAEVLRRAGVPDADISEKVATLQSDVCPDPKRLLALSLETYQVFIRLRDLSVDTKPNPDGAHFFLEEGFEYNLI